MVPSDSIQGQLDELEARIEDILPDPPGIREPGGPKSLSLREAIVVECLYKTAE